MPLQNRVAPDASLHAVEARGLLMGNRGGRIHRPDKTLAKRRWASRQWIACELHFKNRQREVWGNSYTELFFLDEVTALAAGHRPCVECRRTEARAFLAGRKAPEFDRAIHAERLALHDIDVASLPAGVMVEREGCFFAVKSGQLLRWSFAGYVSAEPVPQHATLRLLTPPTIVQILQHGYQPRWHPSALQWEAT